MEILEQFYDRLRKQCSLSDLGIPTSKVFFVRRAIEERTGVYYSLSHVYIACFLEGYIDPDKHFGSGLPQWYIDKYFSGKAPDMEKLRVALRRKFAQYSLRIQDNEHEDEPCLRRINEELKRQNKAAKEF